MLIVVVPLWMCKVEGSNTLTLDLEAIKSGKAVVKEKAPKLKVEKKSKEKIST